MIRNNSGKIYILKLDYNLGDFLCQFVDFTDISPFDGKLIYVFDLLEKDVIDLEKVSDSPLLFGPTPLLKYPNHKGKGAWPLLGQINNIKSAVPTFKGLRGKEIIKDWSTLDAWYPIKNFREPGEFCDYELVRHLEMPILHGMEDIKVRAAMQILLRNDRKVANYFDLKDFHFRNLFIRTVNTSFTLSEAKEFLKEID